MKNIVYQYCGEDNKIPFINVRQHMRMVMKSARNFVDRFGILPDNRDILYDPFPEFTDKGIMDLCAERVEEIISKAGSRDIVIFSSGGVDSICTVASFIMMGYGDRIKVVEFLSDETDYDYVRYFRKNGIDYGIYTGFDEFMVNNAVIVDGNCADQLNHSMSMFPKSYYYNIPANHDVVLYKRYQSYNKLLSNDVFLEWLERAPMPIRTENEIRWYISYCCKWREAAYQHLPYYFERNYGYAIDINNYFAFFNTKGFSDWGFTHYKENLAIDVSKGIEYKRPFKEVFLKVAADEYIREKYRNRIKGFSLGHDNVVNNDDSQKTAKVNLYSNTDKEYKYFSKDKSVFLTQNDRGLEIVHE